VLSTLSAQGRHLSSCNAAQPVKPTTSTTPNDRKHQASTRPLSMRFRTNRLTPNGLTSAQKSIRHIPFRTPIVTKKPLAGIRQNKAPNPKNLGPATKNLRRIPIFTTSSPFESRVPRIDRARLVSPINSIGPNTRFKQTRANRCRCLFTYVYLFSFFSGPS
jgi:hypothetical protein